MKRRLNKQLNIRVSESLIEDLLKASKAVDRPAYQIAREAIKKAVEAILKQEKVAA
jgi:predicted DNA-binding protein